MSLSLLQPIIMLDAIEALGQRGTLVKHDPFAGVPHERQIELAVADELHASEFGLERR